jgi:hypothetical protein
MFFLMDWIRGCKIYREEGEVLLFIQQRRLVLTHGGANVVFHLFSNYALESRAYCSCTFCSDVLLFW